MELRVAESGRLRARGAQGDGKIQGNGKVAKEEPRAAKFVDLSTRRRRRFLGVALLVYYAYLVVVRWHLRGVAGLYEAAWGCQPVISPAKVALVWAALGMLLDKTLWISGSVVLVGATHLLWMLDLAGLIATGKNPIGVCAYLTWPSTTYLEISSTLHHAWFIPSCLLTLAGTGRPTFASWLAAAAVGFAATALSRMLTEKDTVLPDGTPWVINLNFAWEFGSDIPFAFVHLLDGATGIVGGFFYLVYVNIIMSGLINTPFYLLFRTLNL